MSAQTNAITTNDVVTAVLGLADDRAALIALGVVGFVMCSLGGIGKTQATLGWTHPITIVGMLLGVAALLVVVLPLINVKLPVLATDRSAFIALAVIMLVKVGLSGAGRFIA